MGDLLFSHLQRRCLSLHLLVVRLMRVLVTSFSLGGQGVGPGVPDTGVSIDYHQSRREIRLTVLLGVLHLQLILQRGQLRYSLPSKLS